MLLAALGFWNRLAVEVQSSGWWLPEGVLRSHQGLPWLGAPSASPGTQEENPTPKAQACTFLAVAMEKGCCVSMETKLFA